MDYEIGSATDAHDMLDKIRLFLVANGWTQDDYASETYGYRLNMHRGALYINMFSTIGYDPITTNSWTYVTYRMNGIAFSPATGYTASPGGTKPWKNMPGVPYLSSGYADNAFACCVGHMTGAVTSYHMAADGDNFICAMETATGFFRWVAFGTLAAYGAIGSPPNGFYLCTSNSTYDDESYTGSGGVEMQRIFAHRTTGAFRNAALRFADNWHMKESGARIVQPIPTIGNSVPTNRNDFHWGLVHPLYDAMPADIGGLSPLLPAQIGVEYSGYEVPVGHFDLARITSMKGFSVGQQITVGGDDFVVVPCPSAEAPYYPYAIAIRITGA